MGKPRNPERASTVETLLRQDLLTSYGAPQGTAVLAPAGWGCVACRVLKIPEPDSCRQASRTPGRARARKCACWRPLPNTCEGRVSSRWLPFLCVVAGLLGRPWQDEICRARGSAPQTHAAGSRSRQACCAWSPRKAAESRSPISRAGACRFQSGGTARLASHQTRQAHAVWHAAPCETLMGWMPGASVKV